MSRKLIESITDIQRLGARAWYQVYGDVVDAAAKRCTGEGYPPGRGYPPTGLCAAWPELWCDPHWAWFLATEPDPSLRKGAKAVLETVPRPGARPLGWLPDPCLPTEPKSE